VHIPLQQEVPANNGRLLPVQSDSFEHTPPRATPDEDDGADDGADDGEDDGEDDGADEGEDDGADD